MRVEEIGFEGAGVRLSGSVLLPDGVRESSGLVLVGGSGPSDRHNGGLFDAIGAHLVRSGVAVLVYDKRGVGGSTGSWAAATVDQLAADAAAAVSALCSRDGLESVGVLGHSEGGWVALRLAAQRSSAAGLILQSCPAVSFVEAEMFALTSAGVSPADAEAVGRLLRELAETAPSRKGFADAERLVAAAQREAWYGIAAAQGFSFDHAAWEQIRVWGPYSPWEDLERLTIPTLVVLGGDDPLVPVQESVRAYETTAAHTHRRQRVAVFAGADHRLKLHDGNFVPNYLPTLAQWSKSA